jgi:hypothetical protein
VSARSVLTGGSGSLAFVLIHPKVQLGTGAMQGVRRPSEVQGCEPEQELKDYCCRCAGSKEFQHLKVFENLPQGVRARIFQKALGRGKSRRIEPSKESKGVKGQVS